MNINMLEILKKLLTFHADESSEEIMFRSADLIS